MKLSEATLNVLKNFRDINTGIVIKSGNKLRTISTNKAILAEALVAESFPREVGIYDLGKLLDVLSLHGNPDLDFQEQFIALGGQDGRARTRIRYSEPKLILTPPNKEINVPSFDVTLTLSAGDLQWIEKVGSILKCPYVVFENDPAGNVTVSAADVKGEVVDDSSLDLGKGNTNEAFKYVLKVENLKLLPGTYEVKISSRGLANFVNKEANLTYWVAVEKNASQAETKAA